MISKVFDDTVCTLGESALWHEDRQTFVWLDILQRRLYERGESAGEHRVHQFDFTPSAVLKRPDSEEVALVTDIGVYSYNLESRALSLEASLSLPGSHRTNDAGLDPEGRIVFGTMEWEPTGRNGSIYRVEKNGDQSQLAGNIGIPNTLICSEDGETFYYSDSYRQCMYSTRYGDTLTDEALLFDLSSGVATPDGSCIFRGMLVNAEWDGSRVALRDMQNGGEIACCGLPVPRPTSCAVGGKKGDKLLITTASVDMSTEDLTKYPLSGKTFVVSTEQWGQSFGQ